MGLSWLAVLLVLAERCSFCERDLEEPQTCWAEQLNCVAARAVTHHVDDLNYAYSVP